MEFVAPGPIDGSLLRHQSSHISTQIWEGEQRILRPRHNYIRGDMPDEAVQHLIHAAGFGHALRIPQVPINHHLITALVERWRPETHTFHLSVGESTITLEDVANLLGLPIDGEVVTGSIQYNWMNVCEHLLGVAPPPSQFKGQCIRLKWLKETFSVLPANATRVVLEQHARAWILRMIGGFLMPDTSGSRVHLMYLPLLQNLEEAASYSWGSTVLACLYRGLHHATKNTQIDIGGCLLLLQSWAWERIPCIAPQIQPLSQEELLYQRQFPLACRWCHVVTTFMAVNVIRLVLDRLHINQFIWMPYHTPDVRRLNIPNVSRVARAIVPLICFATVEWHPTDRVMRQFGLRQCIPSTPPNFDKLHGMDMRGRGDVHWPDKHRQWIALWQTRHTRLVEGESFTDILH